MKALLVVAFKNYQEKEFKDTKNALEKEGIETVVASSNLGKARGKFGGEVEIDAILENINIEKFNAIIFIGGGGAQEYFESESAHRIIIEAGNLKIIIAAICCAPMILLKAGILNNKKATVWPDEDWIKDISKAGRYINEDVVKDGNIITASGPEAAKKFGETIAKSLKEDI